MKTIINFAIIGSILFVLLLLIIKENKILDRKIIQLNRVEFSNTEPVNQDSQTMPSLTPDTETASLILKPLKFFRVKES